MKKILGVLLVTAAAALMVSCVNSNYNKPATAGTTIAVEEHSDVPTLDFLGVSESNIETNKNGDLILSAIPDKPLTGELELGGQLAGELVMKPGNFEKGLIPSTDNAGNAGIVVTVSNPAPHPIVFKGSVSLDGASTVALPDVTVGAGETVDIAYVPSLTDPDIDADIFEVLPDVVVKSMKAAVPNEVKIADVEIGAATKALGANAAKYSFSVNSAFVIPMKFSKGSVLKFEQSFKNLGFDLTEYVKYQAKEYKVTFKMTNSMPFDIKLSATSSQGLSGTLDNVIKAGTVANPVVTPASLTVKTANESVSTLEDAVLKVEMTAASEDAALNKAQKLEIDMESIHIEIVG